MAFVKMRNTDGSYATVNTDLVGNASNFEKDGYTTDLNKPLDYDKLGANSIYRKENAQYTKGAYVPAQEINKGGVVSTVGTTRPTTQPIGDFADIQAQLEDANRAKIMAELGKSKDASLSNLAQGRDTSLSNLGAEKAKIQPMYYNSRNSEAVGSQLGAKNFAEYMANRGQTRAGASLQGESNRMGTLQGNIGNLNVAENQAKTENDRMVTDTNNQFARSEADVKNAYNSDVQSASAGLQAQSLQNTIDQLRREQDIARQDADTAYNRNLDVDNTSYNRLQDTKNEYANNVSQYYENYQAEINKVKGDGDPSNDWQIAELTKARQQKIGELEAIDRAQKVAEAKAEADRIKAEEEKAQQGFENKLKQDKLNYDLNKPYFAPKSSGSGGLTANQTLTQENEALVAELTNDIFNRGSAEESLGILRQNKAEILQNLINAGYNGKEALEYWNLMVENSGG